MKLQAYMDSLSPALKDKQVAGALKVSRSFVSEIRRGLREPSLRLAVEIEKWSGGAVRPADLLVEG